MSKRSVLHAVPLDGGELLLLYFKDGENVPSIVRKHDGSLFIEFENGKPVFDGIAP